MTDDEVGESLELLWGTTAVNTWNARRERGESVTAIATAAARELLGPGPRGRRHSGPPAASVRGYHVRRAAGQAKTLARHRLRAVAVDGKTSRGARRADRTRVHLLGDRRPRRASPGPS